MKTLYTRLERWSLSRRLFTGIGALLALLFISDVVLTRTAASIQDDLEIDGARINRRVEAAFQINYTLEALFGSETTQLIAGYVHDSTLYAARQQKVETELADVGARIVALREQLDDADEQRQIEQLRKALSDWAHVHAEITALADVRRLDEAVALHMGQGQAIKDRMRPATTAIVDAQRALLAAHIAESTVNYRRSQRVTIVLVLISLVTATLVVLTIRRLVATLRTTAHDLRSGSQQVLSASHQVASSAMALSQGATEQAAALEQTSASMEEMSAMTQQSADNARAAATLMGDANTQVRASNEALGAMVGSMTAIRESSQQVAHILKAIDEIAFQTNILALNAAVEAARAGVAGMGFAVVADEVRNLAQRSAQAARDTAALIDVSIGRTEEGHRRVEEVSGSIVAITDSVARVTRLVDEVSVASRQQAEGIAQVTQAIGQMEKVTQGTAATAEESAAASEELNAQAEVTLATVDQLTVMVDGRASTTPTHERSASATPSASSTRLLAVPASLRQRTTTTDRTADQSTTHTGTFGRF